MSKQTLWIKKRTSRGNGRKINNRAKATAKNIDRDLRKNQLAYAYYLLKFVLVFALGLLWFRLGVVVGPMTVLPIGFVIGLVVVAIEKIPSSRYVELGLLVCSTLLSYFLPIGLVI